MSTWLVQFQGELRILYNSPTSSACEAVCVQGDSEGKLVKNSPKISFHQSETLGYVHREYLHCYIVPGCTWCIYAFERYFRLDFFFFFFTGPRLNGAVSAEQTDISPVRNDEVQQLTRLSSIYLPRFTFLNSSITFRRLSNLVRKLFGASLSPSATAPAWRQLSVTVLARDQQYTLVMRPVTCMCP